MYQLNTQIDINASPERVWEILTDGDAYESWNPFIRRLKGHLGRGEKLCVLMTPPGNRGITLRPRVIRRDEGRAPAWLGRLLIPGIFDGEHHFEVHPIDNDKSRFVQWEKFTGLLVPVFRKMLSSSTRKGFDAMNEALKRQAESVAKGAEP